MPYFRHRDAVFAEGGQVRIGKAKTGSCRELSFGVLTPDPRRFNLAWASRA
jgi:hypothetical protein